MASNQDDEMRAKLTPASDPQTRTTVEQQEHLARTSHATQAWQDWWDEFSSDVYASADHTKQQEMTNSWWNSLNASQKEDCPLDSGDRVMEYAKEIIMERAYNSYVYIPPAQPLDLLVNEGRQQAQESCAVQNEGEQKVEESGGDENEAGPQRNQGESEAEHGSNAEEKRRQQRKEHVKKLEPPQVNFPSSRRKDSGAGNGGSGAGTGVAT